MSDLRPAVQSALQALASGPLRDSAKNLLKTLGYQSDRTLNLEGSKPQAFLDLIASQGGQSKFDESKALFSDWKSADILFQLSDKEISSLQQGEFFEDNNVKTSLLQSYLFFAIELTGGDYARGKLTSIARQINRVFPMPVMLLIRHGDATGTPVLSIAVINRRRNKVHAEKDVLEKVTLIRDISLADPHRGHLDILASFAVENLVHPKKLPITDFDSLHAAWEQIFNIELLNARFYRELSNWYFWALPQVEFPADLEPDKEKRNATGLIRLLTRLIFCWFLKEKSLIPEKLFHATDLAKILKGFDPESETSSTYYQAILQNLFFATLNQRMGKDGNGKPYRIFATDEGFAKNRATYDVNNLYRYEALFRDGTDAALAHFADIPFLNGGLFECLDRTEDGTDKKRYLDGFSRNPKKRPHVPDRLFFDSGETADLSTAYGDTKRKAEKVTGLITILNRYKFTIVENTPIDQEIALDPELLGKVFENLLASYNEETKTTARKQTGSFYTPRPIVDYMVDESLKAHLERKLTTESTESTEQENQNSLSVNSVQSVVKKSSFSTIRQKLDHLFAYTEDVPDFSEQEKATLIAAIDALKILDPACGSGAFPMGVLHKLVYLLSKLDMENVAWEKIQLSKAQEIKDSEERRKAIAEIMSNFADNNDDYGRKLYLIENCLYGVDIQPIAIQITKLRFFISLVCDQKTNRNKKDNHGIRPLPNLETKFVAADTLIGLPEMTQSLLVDPRVSLIEKEIESLYHSHFSIQRRDQKLALQRKIKSLRQELAKLLAESLMSPAKSKHVAEWDPFDPQSSADFFDPHWMFGSSLANGFDVIIGNPPYKTGLTEQEKETWGRLYPEGKKKIFDIYNFFMVRGLQLCKKRAVFSFIVPPTWLNNKNSSALRKLLISNGLTKLNYIADQVFQSAVVDSVVFFVTPGNSPRAIQCFTTHDYSTEGFSNLSNSIVTADLDEQAFLPSSAAQIEPLADRIFGDGHPKLGGITKIVFGIQTRKSADGPNYLHEKKVNTNCKQAINGKDMGRFFVVPSSLFVEYGPWLWNPRDEAIFKAPEKILIRQVGRFPICAMDERQFYSLNTIFNAVVTSSDFTTRYVLGVLNSKLVRYLWGRLFPEVKDVFPRVKKEQLVDIPICRPSKSQAHQMEAVIDRIHTAKKADHRADTSALEREIDQQVYALYGLTPEEIAIVEGTAP